MGKIPSVSEALLRMYVNRSRNDSAPRPGVAIVIPNEAHKTGAEALVADCADLNLGKSEVVIITHVDPSLTTGDRLDDGRYVLLYSAPRRN